MERKRKIKAQQSKFCWAFFLFPEGKCFGTFVVAARKESFNLYSNRVGSVRENIGLFDGYGVSWLNILKGSIEIIIQ